MNSNWELRILLCRNTNSKLPKVGTIVGEYDGSLVNNNGSKSVGVGCINISNEMTFNKLYSNYL